MKIFVSIAAYRDPELKSTIQSLVDNSSSELTICLIQQCYKEEMIDTSKFATKRCKFTGEWMHPRNARGAGYARKLALHYVSDEQYYLQVDSHTQFIKHWDLELINQLQWAASINGDSKVVLSQFPAAYTLEDGEPTPLFGSSRYPSVCTRQYPYVNKQGYIVAKRGNEIANAPHPSTMLLAGYIFAPIEFTHLGYDENIPFWGEEFMLTLAAWKQGWRIYSPETMVLMHHYGRRGQARVWEDLTKWPLIEFESQEYQAQVFSTLDTSGLHDDHKRVIDEFLKLRGVIKEQNHTETEFLIDKDIITTIVDGRPT